ncbi:Permease of the drug/metabolite transporter (DMT) superfamily [Enhydrobacter aerosaccus]|uniref:Permease of the drug/metabolite transporter (DMT) superfamily n=1 Tax=Enhydrobacter aerosaccus TaxID=225324 RepID=A0A1T4KYH8_9HYPH|nr:DMT family transporter [Enhydrobacter aerosaccus]SJZ47514.1 Permease of the drug/metabolite transporter (DMT) superfamily [Enhydrobacter aerosaccus]
MSLRIWGLLLLLSVLWGGSFFFAKVAVRELPPLTVVFGRVALAAVALNLLQVLSGKGLFRRGAPWPAYVAMGTLNNALPFSLIFWGQTQIASGLASILNATTPLFTVVVAHLLTTDEKMTRAKVAAVVMGVLGVAVLIGPVAVQRPDASLWGQIACLAAAVSYAFAGIYGRRFKAMGIGPIEAAAGQITASSMLILPIMLAVDGPWPLLTPHPVSLWASIAGLALLSTALAYVLYFRILAVAGATNLLLVTLLIPVTSNLLGVTFLGEELGFRQVAGMMLIAMGLAIIDGRIGHMLRPAK